MEIIRANARDRDIFTEDELAFGGCCFCTEDRVHRFFFEINGREAVLHSGAAFVDAAIDEFLFYSGFITTIRDGNGNVLRERKLSEPYLCGIMKIRPSQFYISEDKLAACKKWIKSREDVYIPVLIRNGETIAQDGHTRLRAALDSGFEAVYVYEEEYDPAIMHFVDEAGKRGIKSVADMEILSEEEYKLKWHKYCKDYFAGLEQREIAPESLS